MAGPAVEYVYRYPFASEIDSERQPELRLATFTDDDSSPHFFQGGLRYPHQTAKLLLALVWLLRSRFHRPELMVLGADPIVTAHESFLRLEVFSNCCSVYARVDLPPDAIDGETLGRGATNVDFNPPMIAALGKIRANDDLRLSVGADEFVLRHKAGEVVERRVQLPIRWLKGLVAVTAYGSQLKCVHDVSAAQAQRFLRSLPRQVEHRSRWWVCRSASGLRLSQRESANAVETGGLERLRVLEDLVHMAKSMRIYQAEGVEASCWVLEFETARLTMLMTHDVWRGFSGEGQGLEQMALRPSDAALDSAKAVLRWQAIVDPALISESDAARGRLRDGLAFLATQGLVGFDSFAGHYFHRELPFDFAAVEKLQPRLKAARKLVEAQAISRAGDVFTVRSGDTTHTVRIVGDDAHCTCPWYAKHQNRRGPCKHILAVTIVTEQGRGD